MKKNIYQLVGLFCIVVSVAYPLQGQAAQNDVPISISGTLLTLDNKTPHVACVVQVVTPQDLTVVATTLSDELGKYQLDNLKPGPYQVRCHVRGFIIEHQ